MIFYLISIIKNTVSFEVYIGFSENLENVCDILLRI